MKTVMWLFLTLMTAGMAQAASNPDQSDYSIPSQQRMLNQMQSQQIEQQGQLQQQLNLQHYQQQQTLNNQLNDNIQRSQRSQP